MEQMQLKEIYNDTVNGVWQTAGLDVQYRIERTDDNIIITFQGSVSVLDWKHNFSFWKKPYRDMHKMFFVHAGFLKMYKSVRPYIREAIKHAFEEDKLIKIRGYSQGAALALLAHEDVFFQINRHANTIVFGCPRVFSIFGSKELKLRMSRVKRVQNKNDIVCGLPPFVFLYRHYGELFQVGRRCLGLSIKDHTTYRENLNG